MLDIVVEEDGTIRLAGRFDASQVEKAEEVFNKTSITCKVDFQNLSYISSAGLGVLLMTQKRLKQSGSGLVLTNLSQFVREVFQIARFDQVFQIETGG